MNQPFSERTYAVSLHKELAVTFSLCTTVRKRIEKALCIDKVPIAYWTTGYDTMD